MQNKETKCSYTNILSGCLTALRCDLPNTGSFVITKILYMILKLKCCTIYIWLL